MPFDYDRETKTLSLSSPVEGTFEVCYRVPSEMLSRPFFNRDIQKYDYIGNYVAQESRVKAYRKENELFETPGLYKSGSISRGVTIGNRQNLFVNSSLNLQLQGRVADNLSISAVITDQNIPFQPEGNTQQLRDFDNVYIRLYNEKINIVAGDVLLKNRDEHSYFLRYYKNQQGIQASYNTEMSNGWSSHSKSSAGVAKGKFASTKIPAIEGVQGPYRLRGADNEQFIVILANSEKVYFDGKLLTRGFDRDYIIDYNLGEITFNPSVTVTRFSRIRIDFEYAQQEFPRSNLQFSQVFTKNRTKIYLDFYREKDNQDNPLHHDFSDEDLRQLSDQGDVATGSVSGVNMTGFVPERILYKQIDTIVSGNSYLAYVHSIHSDSAIYNVNFTDVGEGNGDYVLSAATSNGRIYEWVSPVNGVSQGKYDPVVNIVTPNKRQMSIFGIETRLGTNVVLSQELAYSDHDKNLLSDVDDNDNHGLAWRGGLRLTETYLSFLPGYRMSSSLSFEYDGTNFLPIDRFRSIDFDRDWNYLFPNDSVPASEKIISGSFNLSKDAKNRLIYDVAARNRENAVEGIQHTIELKKEIGRIFYSGRHFLLDNQVITGNSRWLRSYSEMGVNLGAIETGYFHDRDRNEVSDDSGKIISSAMHYRENGLFIRNGDSTKFSLDIIAGLREDKLPVNGDLENYTKAKRLQVKASPIKDKNHRTDFTFAYRDVESRLFDESNDRTIQGRLSSFNEFFDENLSSTVSYATSNSRELKREFIYTLVGAGQGTHTWRDENEDDIQDLNEFYEAINPDERNYIKLFVPTDEYIEAFQTIYQHTIDIRFPSRWRGGHYFTDKISRLSFQSNWNVNFRTTSDDYNDRLNPFFSVSDSSVLFSRSNSRYSIFYNKSQPGVGVILNRIINKHKQLNLNGFELTERDRWETNVRYNLSRSYQVDLKLIKGNRQSNSDFLESRNFDIREYQASGKFTWILTPATRISIAYTRGNKSNVLLESSSENVSKNEVGSEVTWSKAKVGNLSARVEFLNLNFDGQQDTYLGYTLLEALQPGNNLRTEVNWQQSLRKGLQLTFQYFGRKSENTSMIHSGSMRLTAFF